MGKQLWMSGALLFLGTGAIATAGRVPVNWNAGGAAHYMDNREGWWQGWHTAQRDQGTVCVSCHTAAPYALSRPLLRHELGESALAPSETAMLASVRKRVSMWDEIKPYYENSANGPTKTAESRGTEAVLNSLILAGYDSIDGKLSAATEQAFEIAWKLQLTTGDKAGAWDWLDFHNGPWEATDSFYMGTVMEALAVGLAPQKYSQRKDIQPNVQRMTAYLRRNYAAQPLINKTWLLWASAHLSGVLTKSEQEDIRRQLYAKQQADGGWTLTTLGEWKREDETALETKSDGYATGMALLALEENDLDRGHPEAARGIDWLVRNQVKETGAWPAYSVNRQRDRNTDIGRFMDDAATGYAVLALSHAHTRLVAVNEPVTSTQKPYGKTQP